MMWKGNRSTDMDPPQQALDTLETTESTPRMRDI